MTEALGKYVVIKAYVDANHAVNMANRMSHYGIIIYVNNAPIICYSKRQNTVKASSFGSKFFDLRIATDIIDSLLYKLRCFGVPVDGPTEVFCDNNSAVNNSIIPIPFLNKRHNTIYYHRLRDAQATGDLHVDWIPG